VQSDDTGESPASRATAQGRIGDSSLFGKILAMRLWNPLKVRDFRWLWSGSAFSALGDAAFFVALAWLVLQVSGPGVGIGVVLAVGSIPGTILLPLGGVLSDRVSPLWILTTANVVRCALVGSLAALLSSNRLEIWHLYVLAGSLSIVDALYYPASMSMIPRLVSQSRLEGANALAQGVDQICGIAGPVLAGALVSLFGLGSTFAAIAVLFLAAGGTFAGMMRLSGAVSGQLCATGSNNSTTERHPGALDDFTAGLRYGLNDPLIRSMLVILVGVNCALMGPLYVGGVMLADSELGGGGAFGILVAVACAGALLGGVVAGSFEWHRRGPLILVSTGVAGVGVSLVAFVDNLVVASALGFAFCSASSFAAILIISLIQGRSDPAFVGRTMSLVMFAATALDPVSFLLAGVLAELGLTVLFLSAGGLVLLTALASTASGTVRAYE
jgi:hypothetical protein